MHLSTFLCGLLWSPIAPLEGPYGVGEKYLWTQQILPLKGEDYWTSTKLWTKSTHAPEKGFPISNMMSPKSEAPRTIINGQFVIFQAYFYQSNYFYKIMDCVLQKAKANIWCYQAVILICANYILGVLRFIVHCGGLLQILNSNDRNILYLTKQKVFISCSLWVICELSPFTDPHHMRMPVSACREIV